MEKQRWYSEEPPVTDELSGAEVELYVRRSDEHLVRFDPQHIIDALVREARLDVEMATRISQEIKQLIIRSGIRALSSSLIRELVDAKLIEYGLEKAHRAHSRLGVPLYDADRIIRQAAREAGAHPHGPEGTSLTLAEAIKREYAILSVFSDRVADAHLTGDIHIQGIGAIDRPHALVSSIDYIKRHGMALPFNFSSSRPARHPEVLIAHIVKMSAALQGYLSGPIVWDSLNFSLAPFLTDCDDRDLRQLAQALVFELSAPAVARGGQVITCDLHLDWDAPPYLASRPAIGPLGQETGKTHAEYADPARRFLHQLLEVYLEGDGSGRPFLTPRLILHITDSLMTSPAAPPLLELVGQIAVSKGGLRLVFDREERLSYWSRFGVMFEPSHERVETWRWRTASLQSVALNLPRLGYRAKGDLLTVLQSLTELLEVAAQAHLERRVFLEKLMALGENGPLALLALRRSEATFLKLAWTTHLICPIGLDELVTALGEKHLHESDRAVDLALRILGHLVHETERLSLKHNVRFVLADSDDELTAHRFARLDLRSREADQASRVVSGDAATGDVYYTNPLKVLPAAPTSALERVRIEGLLHHLGCYRVTTPIWLGDRATDPAPMTLLLTRAFYQTHCASLLPAPEFTLCLECGQTIRGLHSPCPHCRSSRVDGLAISAHHFSRVSGWNRGLIAQLRDRYRVDENFD
ncbi:MAG TPA: anaerobic ribonucleoside-triphosphate reductase [Blastocatellia bacterium]|nr:anaerobic ribonucleoside-triphosphate reductase [Blastocatellia bacterium]